MTVKLSGRSFKNLKEYADFLREKNQSKRLQIQKKCVTLQCF